MKSLVFWLQTIFCWREFNWIIEYNYEQTDKCTLYRLVMCVITVLPFVLFIPKGALFPPPASCEPKRNKVLVVQQIIHVRSGQLHLANANRLTAGCSRPLRASVKWTVNIDGETARGQQWPCQRQRENEEEREKMEAWGDGGRVPASSQGMWVCFDAVWQGTHCLPRELHHTQNTHHAPCRVSTWLFKMSKCTWTLRKHVGPVKCHDISLILRRRTSYSYLPQWGVLVTIADMMCSD